MDMQKNNNNKQHLLQALRALSLQHVEATEQRLFEGFIAHAVQDHLDIDYLNRPLEMIFWNLYGLYRCMRAPGEDCFADGKYTGQIEIYNPSQDTHGWESDHTLIYINGPDRPFLVDSLRIALNAQGPTIYNLRSTPLWIGRDDDGMAISIAAEETPGTRLEAIITVEIEPREIEEIAPIRQQLVDVLHDIDLVVGDFSRMRNELANVIDELERLMPECHERDESLAFLRWMDDGAFVFLGFIAFALEQREGQQMLCEVENSRLGLFFGDQDQPLSRPLDQLSAGVKALYGDDQVLSFATSSHRSHIHRSGYAHYVVVKRLDESGHAIGELRFMGLHSSRFYSSNSARIPILRSRVEWLLENAGFAVDSHDHKSLRTIADGYPRDELLQMPADELLETLIGIWQIYERNAIRVFAHRDQFEKFVSCLVFIPRELFSTRVREKIQREFEDYLEAGESTFASFFLPESMLVRIYLLFPVSPGASLDISISELEALVARIASNWNDDFAEVANHEFGPHRGSALVRGFSQAFSEAYKEHYTPQQALQDVYLLENLSADSALGIGLRASEKGDDLHLKLFHRSEPVALSDMIPVLENIGFRVLMERPYEISLRDQDAIWVQDFALQTTLEVAVEIDEISSNFSAALRSIWSGDAEDDRFNRLLIAVGLDWRSVALFRLYARYLKQLGVSYSQDFIANTLAEHHRICADLMRFFNALFDPKNRPDADDGARAEEIKAGLISQLDKVENISQDNVLRAYVELMEATQRCNFYQRCASGEAKPYLSVKFATEQIARAPKPRPVREIFVYSPRFEGVHLRGGKVSRGGLRWSDRLEDYRTEVLGLVKAQQVKNAVIVPTGAKGGFVAKQATIAAGRDAWLAEGTASYKLYIQALLDLTDNYLAGEIIPPPDVVRRDGDDPYLVVAADKGTATFSDVANQLSEQHNFWLGDAFASGGSHGYDHKAMGITARGAWVAVRRHFRELGVDIQNKDFSVIGIGDMGGDVFGNGMLLSEHIQLVGAFNHLHIFVDPNADASRTYAERRRLFETAGSSWQDFDPSLLSPGARIYSRSAKMVELSAEIKQRFAIDADHMTPNELISALLIAPVDLLWNGGIGTYIKASTESHDAVGDKANDSLRVNGDELRARVLGEGGNLGITQLGRIEFSRLGGMCNTDFIDNAAGVDCSDHEVNIKILLNAKVMDGDLSVQQRNELLASMTEAVGDKVLRNNARQTQAISLALHRGEQQNAEYQRFVVWLEDLGQLDRKFEFLPSDDQLSERVARKQPPWTRPELSVLVCYSKVMLKEALLDADLLGDAWLADAVEKAFPRMLTEYCGGAISSHQLAAEIAATQLANDLVDRFGFSFFYRQMEATGASAGEVVRALTVVVNVLGIDELWLSIESDESSVSATRQLDLLHILIKLVRRATRWFLRNNVKGLGCAIGIEQFAKPMHQLLQHWDGLRPQSWQSVDTDTDQTIVVGPIAAMQTLSENLFLSLGIIEISLHSKQPVERVAEIYAAIGTELLLDELMVRIVEFAPQSRWQDLARESFFDQLEQYRRQLTSALLARGSGDADSIIAQWRQRQLPSIARWRRLMDDQRRHSDTDLALVTVALSDLLHVIEDLQRMPQFD